MYKMTYKKGKQLNLGNWFSHFDLRQFVRENILLNNILFAMWKKNIG